MQMLRTLLARVCSSASSLMRGFLRIFDAQYGRCDFQLPIAYMSYARAILTDRTLHMVRLMASAERVSVLVRARPLQGGEEQQPAVRVESEAALAFIDPRVPGSETAFACVARAGSGRAGLHGVPAPRRLTPNAT